MFKSIRWTLQLWHAAILAAALTLFGVSLYYSVQQAQTTRVDAELEGALHALATTPPPMPRGRGRRPLPPWDVNVPREPIGDLPGRPDDFDDRRPPEGPPRRFPEASSWWARLPMDFLQRIGQNTEDQPYFVIWDAQGQVLRRSSPSQEVPRPTVTREFRPGPEGPPARPTIRQRGKAREAFLPGPFGSTVLVGRSLASEARALRQLGWKLLGAGFGIMAVGICGGWLLSRRVLRPIRTISDAASAISASDLSRRIVVEEGHDELGSLAQTLNQTFDRLETAFERQVRFTADASHELRTPVTVIHSQAELALNRERSAPEYKQALETCLRAAKRTRSLIDALLVLARADAGHLQLNRERFDLKQAAEESVSLVAPRAEEQQVTLETDLVSLEIQADYTRLLQLLTNLLSNAVRYNRRGGRICLSVRQEGDTAVIEVSDTGVGISPEDQDHIFERFYRVDKARSREAGGSGLGLAICQSIVTAHRGTISVSSRPDEGTTFTVRLPLR